MQSHFLLHSIATGLFTKNFHGMSKNTARVLTFKVSVSCLCYWPNCRSVESSQMNPGVSHPLSFPDSRLSCQAKHVLSFNVGLKITHIVFVSDTVNKINISVSFSARWMRCSCLSFLFFFILRGSLWA